MKDRVYVNSTYKYRFEQAGIEQKETKASRIIISVLKLCPEGFIQEQKIGTR
jgi:hypothetical protein